MQKIRVMSVFGTRPEAIKMCPLVNELRNHEEIESIVCVTGQHREMLDQVLDIFNVKPDYDLDIMKARQTLASITTSVVNGIGDVIQETKPNIVLVHGDTSTSFAAALGSFYQQAPVGHVEAGLRTHNKYSPYPEEMNRLLTSRIADHHYSPTENNAKTLRDELTAGNIYVTGNTVIDAFATTVRPGYIFHNKSLNELDFSKRVVLMTAHRRENLGKPMENICDAVLDLCASHPDILVIYPVHLNPAVRDTVFDKLGRHPQIKLIEPLDVQDLHNLMDKSTIVLTDSGGLQEEAPHLGKPVIVLRTETERPEAVEAGTAVVAGVDKQDIIKITSSVLDDKAIYSKMATAVNPYGDGHASERIAAHIINDLKL